MFGDNLKRLRNARGLSQDELAAKLDVSQKTISSWETNRTEPNMGVVQQIADFFNVTTDEMIYGPNSTHVHLPNPEAVRTIPVYGDLSCGTGLFVEDAIIDYVTIPVSMLPNKSAEYFAQYASGDSMEGAGIFEGDLLIFKKTNQVDNGQIGCFCIDDNIATCKKFSLIDGRIYLLPMNDKYSPIPVTPENECFRIIGLKVLQIGR